VPDNVEFLRDGYEEWIAGGFDPEIVFELYAPDVEWDLSAYPLPDFPDRGKGRDQLFRNFVEYFSGWNEYEADVREYIGAGDDVIVIQHERARIGQSGVLIERDVAHVYTVRDSLIVRWRVFETRDEALEATAPTGEAPPPAPPPG
jgi:ketosteroid isomerase-like protein